MKGSRNLLCLVHPLDPRGNKIGGIETHVRLLLKCKPPDTDILFVGADGRGDLELGRVLKLTYEGREFDFLPVVHYADERVHSAANSIVDSLTFQFTMGLIAHLGAIRRALAHRKATIELERFEFSLILSLLRKPIVQVIHGEGSKGAAMDSMLRHYWVVNTLNAYIATRVASAVICVNPTIERKIKQELRSSRKPIYFMPVSVDDGVFRLRPFDTSDGIFKIVFAGRLDKFKDPPTMFRAIHDAWRRLGGALEFHYIGTSDPNRYAEYELIKPFTVLHGFCVPPDVAEIVAQCHCGILTSFFEGMPCYLLETLSVGRPMVVVDLPQFRLLVEEGISGYVVKREDDEASLSSKVAERLVKVWQDIRSGAFEPAAIRQKSMPFTTNSQLPRHFGLHDALAA